MKTKNWNDFGIRNSVLNNGFVYYIPWSFLLGALFWPTSFGESLLTALVSVLSYLSFKLIEYCEPGLLKAMAKSFFSVPFSF